MHPHSLSLQNLFSHLHKADNQNKSGTKGYYLIIAKIFCSRHIPVIYSVFVCLLSPLKKILLGLKAQAFYQFDKNICNSTVPLLGVVCLVGACWLRSVSSSMANIRSASAEDRTPVLTNKHDNINTFHAAGGSRRQVYKFPKMSK